MRGQLRCGCGEAAGGFIGMEKPSAVLVADIWLQRSVAVGHIKTQSTRYRPAADIYTGLLLGEGTSASRRSRWGRIVCGIEGLPLAKQLVPVYALGQTLNVGI